MNHNDFIDKYTKGFNEVQIKATTNIEGATLLEAVPGSGKTTVLIRRIGYMVLVKGIMPENILSLTYTVSAAKEMGTRFSSLFGEELAKRIEFRTINGICAKILAYYSAKIGKNSPSLITDEGVLTRILSKIYQKTTGEYPNENDIKEIRTYITYSKNMLLNDKQVDDLSDKLSTKTPFLDIYKEYNKYLKDNRSMDYDDQMVYAYSLLRKVPELLSIYQNKYKYICVDEAQDTSKIQHLIINLLSTGNIFMVGDEDQAIYSFRAAYPEAMMNFEKTYKNAKVLIMNTNYRSNKKITDAADKLIQHNQNRRVKHIEASLPEENDVHIIKVNDREDHIKFLHDIAGNITRKTAVLYRDNESALPLIDLLLRESIPYYVKNADISFFSHKSITDILYFLKYALDPYNTDAFMQIYFKCRAYLKKKEALLLCDYSKKHRLPVFECAKYISGLSPYVYKNCSEVSNEFNKIKGFKPAEAIYWIRHNLEYDNYLEKNNINANKLEILRQLATKESTISGLLDRLKYLQELLRDKTPNYGAKLVLSTIHSAKGLEWDDVYIIDAIDTIFPQKVPGYSATDEEKATYEEERRLYYVAMTRAKHNLHIFKYKCGTSSFLFDWSAKPKKTRNITKDYDIDKIPQGDIPPKIEEGLLVIHSKFGQGIITVVDPDNIFSVYFKGDAKTRMFSYPNAFMKNMKLI